MTRLLPWLLAPLVSCVPAAVRDVAQRPLGDGLTFVQGGGGNSVVLVKGARALVFDAKMWPYEDAVLAPVREAGAHVTDLVCSHLHFDHTQANGFHPGARIYSAPAVQEALEGTHVGLQAPRVAGLPNMPVHAQLALNFGGEAVQLVHPAAAHTDGDVFAWFADRRVLVTGDLFDNGYYPHVDPSHGGTFSGYLAALERLAEYPAEVVIPGHGSMATRADVVAVRDFVRTIRDGVREGRRKGLSDDAIRAELGPAGPEPLVDLGSFSSRAGVIEGFLREPPQG